MISRASNYSVFITGHFINYSYILPVSPYGFLEIAISHVLVSMSPHQCGVAKRLRFGRTILGCSRAHKSYRGDMECSNRLHEKHQDHNPNSCLSTVLWLLGIQNQPRAYLTRIKQPSCPPLAAPGGGGSPGPRQRSDPTAPPLPRGRDLATGAGDLDTIPVIVQLLSP